MEIRQVAVVGLGTMGAGIAEVFARAGFGVIAIEVDPAALERGLATLGKSLDRAVSKGRLEVAQRAEIAARVTPGGSLGDAAPADLVVEVVPERMEIKRAVFDGLDQACAPGAILATNTSSLPVTDIAAGTRHPGRVAGMHFFNPAPVMRLVEVVSTVHTDDAVTAAVAGLAAALGKTPVQMGDRAGFVANALLLPYLNHAVALLEAGRAGREDIDTAVTSGIGLPMGPLALLDLIGLDTALSIMEVLCEAFGGTRHTPAPLLRSLVADGRLGRKAGRGVYDYGDSPGARDIVQNEAGRGTPGPGEPSGDPAGRDAVAAVAAAAAGAGLPGGDGQPAPGAVAAALLYPHIADAVRMVQDGYASAADVDTAMTLGCGYPRGPLQLADEAGLAAVESALAAMHASSGGDPAFAVPALLAGHAAAGTRFRD